MLDGLDAIPWGTLQHAYGSAEDVPELLRALPTAPAEDHGEEGPLWQLFGNIWHQGTVYKATAYAVPFLIELVADPGTPNRVGILQLLAAIAEGSSYREVHGNRRHDPEFEAKRAQELDDVAKAHRAVAEGLATFIAITEEKGDVSLAAAHVLATLPEHAETVAPILRTLLAAEKQANRRAGILLLLGQTGDTSELTLSAFLAGLKADTAQRRLAAYSLARLRPIPMPAEAREAIMEAMAESDVAECCEGLPWDAAGDIDDEVLRTCLDDSGKNEAAEKLMATIESGKGSHAVVVNLLDLLFARDKPGAARLTTRDLTPLQSRAVGVLARAFDGGKRIFYGMISQWGLPDSKRDFRDLAAGRQPTPVDMTLPLLANAAHPKRTIRPDQLRKGNRIVHRNFGLGTVMQTSSIGKDTTLKVAFDEEGEKEFRLPSDGSSIR